MKKKLMSVLVVGVMMISTVLIGCGSKGTTDLTGTWTSENNDGSYQEAVITENSIEINWVTDDGATKSVYWVGTYTAPTDPYNRIQHGTSERDKEKN